MFGAVDMAESDPAHLDLARQVPVRLPAAGVVNPRVLGFHFRMSDTRGAAMGGAVARWSLARYLRPLED
jgi:hypothetical protein